MVVPVGVLRGARDRAKLRYRVAQVARGATALGAHDSGFRIGQTVSHARFGQGVIVGLEGSGEDARAQIHFKRDGVKWLALAIAKIEPV